MSWLLAEIGLSTTLVATTLQRATTVMEALFAYSAYSVLLREKPKALQNLVRLCAASRWIAEQLAAYPILPGQLYDDDILYAPLERDDIYAALVNEIQSIATSSFDQQLDCLSQFKYRKILRVAAADVGDKITLMKVSDHLNFTAKTYS